MDTPFLPLLAFLLVALALLALLYNGLVRKRNAVDFAFSCIDAQLKKRFDLIPNLIETVKGYMQHEAGVLREMATLRASLFHAPAESKERFALEAQMTKALPSLFAVAENYPLLKADEGFLHLQRSLAEIEEQLSAARRAFSAAIYEYNNAVQTLPSSAIAGLFGFQARAFFEIGEAERQPPRVAF